jgi:hypothetical protein
MKRLLLIIIIIMVAKSCLSQQSSPPVSWQTSNSYIIGASATALATVFAIATENPIEITPQVGPSINWLIESHSHIGRAGILLDERGVGVSIPIK